MGQCPLPTPVTSDTHLYVINFLPRPFHIVDIQPARYKYSIRNSRFLVEQSFLVKRPIYYFTTLYLAYHLSMKNSGPRNKATITERQNNQENY